MVCNLVTYRARSAVREVGYALGFPRPLVDRVAKALETYDSVMVRRDLEAEGGFADFFTPVAAAPPDVARARPGRRHGSARAGDHDPPGPARLVRRRGRPGRHAGQRALAARRGSGGRSPPSPTASPAPRRSGTTQREPRAGAVSARIRTINRRGLTALAECRCCPCERSNRPCPRSASGRDRCRGTPAWLVWAIQRDFYA